LGQKHSHWAMAVPRSPTALAVGECHKYSNENIDAYDHMDSDAYANLDMDNYTYPIPDGNSDADSDSHSYNYSDIDLDGHVYSHSAPDKYVDQHRYTDGYRNPS
jgi:hypothetical protein